MLEAATRWKLKPLTLAHPLRGGEGINLEPLERLHGVVHGDVQGVGFRYFLMREAHRLGLRGWVRNRDNGTVEFVAEGRRSELEQLKQAAEQGPGLARVDRVDDRWSPASGGLAGFELTG